MANSDVLDIVINSVTTSIAYLLPIIAFMTGVVFVFSALMWVTLGVGRRVFKG